MWDTAAHITTVLVGLAGLITILIGIGVWRRGREDDTKQIAAKVDAINLQLTICRRECDRRYDSLMEGGTRYAHDGVHSLRDALQTFVKDIDERYARRVEVNQTIVSLEKLMEQRFDAVDQRISENSDRLQSIEELLRNGYKKAVMP